MKEEIRTDAENQEIEFYGNFLRGMKTGELLYFLDFKEEYLKTNPHPSTAEWPNLWNNKKKENYGLE